MRSPFQSPLDHPDNHKNDQCPRKYPTNISTENRSFCRIQETVYIDPLSCVSDVRHSQIARCNQSLSPLRWRVRKDTEEDGDENKMRPRLIPNCRKKDLK